MKISKKASKQFSNQSGQAVVTLLIIVALIVSLTAGAVVATIINIRTASSVALSEEALRYAEGGIETALINLERNINYAGGSVTFDNGSALISVSGTTTKTIISTGQSGSLYRKIQVVGSYSNTVFSVTSWQELN